MQDGFFTKKKFNVNFQRIFFLKIFFTDDILAKSNFFFEFVKKGRDLSLNSWPDNETDYCLTLRNFQNTLRKKLNFLIATT